MGDAAWVEGMRKVAEGHFMAQILVARIQSGTATEDSWNPKYLGSSNIIGSEHTYRKKIF